MDTEKENLKEGLDIIGQLVSNKGLDGPEQKAEYFKGLATKFNNLLFMYEGFYVDAADALDKDISDSQKIKLLNKVLKDFEKKARK